MNERRAELLIKAAKCFEEASSPFTTEWLSENHVTSDECIDLSDTIATAIKLYVNLPNDERMTLALKQAVSEVDIDPTIKRFMLSELDFQLKLTRMKKK